MAGDTLPFIPGRYFEECPPQSKSVPMSRVPPDGALRQHRGRLPRSPAERRCRGFLRSGLWSEGKDCVERNGSERAKVASVASEEAPRESRRVV